MASTPYTPRAVYDRLKVRCLEVTQELVPPPGASAACTMGGTSGPEPGLFADLRAQVQALATQVQVLQDALASSTQQLEAMQLQSLPVQGLPAQMQSLTTQVQGLQSRASGLQMQQDTLTRTLEATATLPGPDGVQGGPVHVLCTGGDAAAPHWVALAELYAGNIKSLVEADFEPEA